MRPQAAAWNEVVESACVDCPYCGEPVEIVFEEDLEGEMTWDCEVCCRPWSVSIIRGLDGVHVEVATDEES